MDSYIEELINVTISLCKQPFNTDILTFNDVNDFLKEQPYVEPKITTNKKIITRWLHAKLKQEIINKNLPKDTIVHDYDCDDCFVDITVNKKNFTIDVISEFYVFGLYSSTDYSVHEIINCKNIND